MKSHVSDLIEVAALVIIDAAAKCAANRHARDLVTLRSRAEHEGLSFLTITLPSFGKDFERSLDRGRIEPTCFRSFRKHGRAPAFLQGFLARVFSVTDGRILDDPDIAAIEGIRQIAYTFKKLEVECAPKRVSKALLEFSQIESDFDVSPDPAHVESFLRASRVLWDMVLYGAIDLHPAELFPKHGPGSTAEVLLGNQKYTLQRWHDRLEPYFPLLHFVFPNENAYGSEEFERVTVVDEDGEQPVKVITVPKTLKSPRIIAIEPVCMQYTQQAIARALTKRIELAPLSSGHVNFTDQTINQELAMKHSADQRLGTLDLSSASDRVPYALAMRMFDSNPDLQGAIDACRSRFAKLPSGDILRLRKFASMGSALCFPIEAMYFYTCCVVALIEKHNLSYTYEDILRVSRNVYVYGDDLVVPAGDAAAVAETLHKYSCKVNTDKSFWNGKFRESCGVDAFDGEVVTPTYIRQARPSNRREAKGLISWVKSSNSFYLKGYWKTSSYMRNVVEKSLGALPILGPESPGLGVVSFQTHALLPQTQEVPVRVNFDLHRFEVKAWCANPVYQNDELDGYHALMKTLLSLEQRNNAEPVTEGDHLHRSARYGAVTLKRRWVQTHG